MACSDEGIQAFSKCEHKDFWYGVKQAYTTIIRGVLGITFFKYGDNQVFLPRWRDDLSNKHLIEEL